MKLPKERRSAGARYWAALAASVFSETDVKELSSSLLADLMVPDKSVKNPACVIKRSMNRLRYKNKHAAQGGRY